MQLSPSGDPLLGPCFGSLGTAVVEGSRFVHCCHGVGLPGREPGRSVILGPRYRTLSSIRVFHNGLQKIVLLGLLQRKRRGLGSVRAS